MPPSDPLSSISLSVIIPAFNEQKRILRYLTEVHDYLSIRRTPFEILVVDDGSNDETAAVVQRFRDRQTAPVRLIRLDRNQGKGAAVRAGMRQAEGALQLFADADGATSIREVERLEAAIAAGADLAIGSRALAAGDARYTVRARWHRSILGNTFNGLVQRLGIPGIADTQCGFKLFRKAVAQDLFGVACLNGFGFDLELLYVAQRRDYRIAEVPVNWTDQPGSKVRLIRDGWRTMGELLKVRQHHAEGRYSLSGLPPFSDALLDHADPSHF